MLLDQRRSKILTLLVSVRHKVNRLLKTHLTTILLLSLLTLTACATSGGEDYYELRESHIGQHRDKLIAEIGEPSIQLYAPALANEVEVMRYVYMNQTVATDCVDIYIVERTSGNVIEYICQ